MAGEDPNPMRKKSFAKKVKQYIFGSKKGGLAAAVAEGEGGQNGSHLRSASSTSLRSGSSGSFKKGKGSKASLLANDGFKQPADFNDELSEEAMRKMIEAEVRTRLA